MLTTILALIGAMIAAFFSGRALGNYAWGGLIGFAVLVIIQLASGLIVRRKVTKVNQEIQQLMLAVQAKVQRKLNGFQNRPGMNPKMAQAALEKDQTEAIHQAIALTHKMDGLFLWSAMLKKQINTMRMMFHYQAKEFAEVDALLGQCIYFEPAAIAMRMARMYKKDDPKLDKFATRKLRTAKGDSGVILYALYSWIQVRRNDIPGAMKTLSAARAKCSNPVLQENFERLANGKVKLFSNAALGDNWYMLYLEEPKVRNQRVKYQQM